MNTIETKKATFNNFSLIVHKKKDIHIHINDIKHIIYYRWSFFSALSAFISQSFPGIMEVYLNEKVQGRKAYVFRLKYKDVVKLPKQFKEKMGPAIFE